MLICLFRILGLLAAILLVSSIATSTLTQSVITYPTRQNPVPGKDAALSFRNTEYFWVTDFRRADDGSFEGEIGNEPRMVRSVKLGQRYQLARGQIVDWTYIDKVQRRMVGNFTLCALLTKETAQEAETMRRRFKLDCTWLE